MCKFVGVLQESLCRDRPEQHDVLSQLLHRPLLLHIRICIKAVEEGVYNVQLVQGLCMGLQCLVAASHCLGTLQPAYAKPAFVSLAASPIR